MSLEQRIASHAIDEAQRLYLLYDLAGGYSSVGWDVAEHQRQALWLWLHAGDPCPAVTLGTQAHYTAWRQMIRDAAKHWSTTGQRCTAELVPELIGHEGERIEVTYPDGRHRRFQVGRSTGWLPVHLELYNARSLGGSPVYWPAGTTFRTIRRNAAARENQK